MPGGRAVLRRITELGGTASYEDVQHHFADHPANPIPPSKIGGTLTSVKAVQRRIGPDGAGPLLQRDERARRYRIDDVLVAGLQRVFALADVRPDLPVRAGHLTPSHGPHQIRTVQRAPQVAQQPVSTADEL